MKNLTRLSLMVFTLALIASNAIAQTTAFNYQGRLTEGENPANGAFQMQFKLFDALSGGTQIGTTLTDVPVTAAQGVFTVKLDFGANAFSGANRWLEIAVRRNANESYTLLTPREQIASSPYAVRTLSAQTADLALNSNQLGGIAASEYITNSSGSFIRNGTTTQTGNFNISGNGIFGGAVGIGLNPTDPSYRLDVFGGIRSFSNASTGVIAETTGATNAWARFYMRTANRSWVMGTSQGFNGDQFYLLDETGGQSRMTIQPAGGAIAFPLGNVGMGTTTPNTRLTLNGGAAWTNAGWTASMNMQNASALGWEANAAGQRFGIGQSGGGLYFFRTISGFGNAVNPANYDMIITDAGNVGIGTTTPNARLSVNGNATQSLGSFGMPKAMLYVLANGTIARCWNGVTGATTGNCGFSTSGSAGFRIINFGFSITQSFFSITTSGNNSNMGARIIAFDPNAIEIKTFFTYENLPTAVPSDIYVIVY